MESFGSRVSTGDAYVRPSRLKPRFAAISGAADWRPRLSIIAPSKILRGYSGNFNAVSLHPEGHDLERFDRKLQSVPGDGYRLLILLHRITDPGIFKIDNRRLDGHRAALPVHFHKAQDGALIVLRALPVDQHHIRRVDLQESCLPRSPAGEEG